MDSDASNSIASRTRSRYSRTANMVFDIELLREVIIDYAIHDKGIVQPSNVQSCRLVNKAWLQSTSNVLFKAQEPLFNFQIDPKNSNNMEENGTKDLHQFLILVTGGFCLEERIPPYSIKMSAPHYPDRNQQILENVFECLVNCGSGLVNLNLGINDADHSTLWLNTNVLLPKLRKFDVSIEIIYLMSHIKIIEKINFIQAVLNSTEQLKSFVFTCDENSEQLEDSLSTLTLPPSVTEIYLNCLNVGALEALVKNPLPKLRKLKFQVAGLQHQPDTDEMITSILHNVRKTLQKLLVKHMEREDSLVDILLGHNENPTTFQLPLMESLQSLEVKTPLLELQGNPSSLEELVPQLKHLTLRNQTIPTFRKWVDRSCFYSVSSLTVSLRIENVSTQTHAAFFYRINFDSDTLRALKNAFPNVEKLDITFPTLQPEDPVLSVLWEMETLKSLRIYFGSLSPHPFYSLDACLLGIPSQLLQEDLPLEESPDIMNKLQNWEGPSIRNLTNLQKLILISYKVPSCYALSSVTFDFGFFKMPSLKNLTLEKRFIPSGEVKEKWEKEGRSFTAVDTYYHRDRYEGGQS